MDQDKAIRDQLCKAAKGLGARVAEVEQISSLPRSELYGALKGLGADRILLALVSRWGKSIDDADLLKSLRAWNRDGDFKFFRSAAKSSRRD